MASAELSTNKKMRVPSSESVRNCHKSVFSEMFSPGGQIAPTPRRSILHATRASHVPYSAKNQFFRFLCKLFFSYIFPLFALEGCGQKLNNLKQRLYHFPNCENPPGWKCLSRPGLSRPGSQGLQSHLGEDVSSGIVGQEYSAGLSTRQLLKVARPWKAATQQNRLKKSKVARVP